MNGSVEGLLIGLAVKVIIDLGKLMHLNLAGRATQITALLTAAAGYIVVAAEQGQLHTPHQWLAVGQGAVLAALGAIGWHNTLKAKP